MPGVGGQVLSKTCATCKRHLPVDSFNRQRSNKDGLAYHCRTCATVKLNAWRKENREHVRAYAKARIASESSEEREKRYARSRESYRANPIGHRDKYLRRRYGITEADYDERFRAQGGRCCVCGTSDPGHGMRFFAVDHDHSCCAGDRACGKCVRGLLCGSCNFGLGNFRDDVNLLARAIAYLTEENLMKTTTNKDGSITTSSDDEVSTVNGPELAVAKPASGVKASPAEVKVVAPEDEQPAPKGRSKAEGK